MLFHGLLCQRAATSHSLFVKCYQCARQGHATRVWLALTGHLLRHRIGLFEQCVSQLRRVDITYVAHFEPLQGLDLNFCKDPQQLLTWDVGRAAPLRSAFAA